MYAWNKYRFSGLGCEHWLKEYYLFSLKTNEVVFNRCIKVIFMICCFFVDNSWLVFGDIMYILKLLFEYTRYSPQWSMCSFCGKNNSHIARYKQSFNLQHQQPAKVALWPFLLFHFWHTDEIVQLQNVIEHFYCTVNQFRQFCITEKGVNRLFSVNI